MRRPPPITYPPELPVSQARDEIRAAIEANQVVILGGETGSGKTTQLPKICLELGRGQDGLIGHTQPRRIAARSVAARIASELGTKLGEVVGYKVRFTDRTSRQSMVKLMTDGILLAETQGDRMLRAYDTLIIDEAHERSLNIDFLLGYVKQLLPRRPDLKLIITSATIDLGRFSRHFDDAPIVEVSGRTYPVEVRYCPPVTVGDDIPDDPEDYDLPRVVGDAVGELMREGDGDVLVFLSGEREIRECAETLARHRGAGVEVLPLFSRLSTAEQDRIWKPHAGRRIVLSTNVAETSLTVPGIRFVVDPGFARISRYGFRSKVQRLPIERISRASADQRKGRCGRVEAGVCIRLYSEDDYLARPEFTEPEILRTNLAAVILQMKALELGDIGSFPFVEPPDRRQITDGLKLLYELGAIDEEEELTDIGRRLARLPVDPRVGRMLLAAEEHACVPEMLILASALSIQDPRERPMDAREAADNAHAQFADDRSDFLAFLNLWKHFHQKKDELSGSQLRKLCRASHLSYVRMREWIDVHRQLVELAREVELRPPRGRRQEANREQIHQALLAGLLGNIGQKRERHAYVGARGTQFQIFPGSSLFSKKPAWLMASEIVETTRLYARCCAGIEPEWIERAGAHLVKRTRYDPHWDVKAEHVAAYEKVSLYGLVLAEGRRIHYGPHDPVESRHLFLRALADGSYRPKARFHEHNVRLAAEVEKLEERSRRRDVLVGPQTVYDFYRFYLPEDVYSGKTFRDWLREAEKEDPQVLFMTRKDLMQHDAEQVTEAEFPQELEVGNNRLDLRYRFEPGHDEDGVTLGVPVAALPQVNAARCEWLVPGLLREKILMLIKSLPKDLRRNFVPAPDVADRVLLDWQPADSRLLVALSARLGELTGVRVPIDAWNPENIPDHLQMKFEVTEKGKVIGCGRDLPRLQAEHGKSAGVVLANLAGSGYGQRGLTSWSFGELPERVEVPQEGVNLAGFPALVDEGETVALVLLESAATAANASRRGLRRLFALAHSKEVAGLSKRLPGFDRMAMAYSRLGKSDELRRDLVSAILDTALWRAGASEGIPRTAAAYQALDARARTLLSEATDTVCSSVGQALAEHVTALAQVQGKGKPHRAHAVADIRDQLEHLIYRGFVAETHPEHLQHLPRYLAAIHARLEKLRYAPEKDTERSKQVQMPWAGYKQRAAKNAERGLFDPDLIEFRWLIEEFRVSLFAQELGTARPVSWKRLEKLWRNMG